MAEKTRTHVEVSLSEQILILQSHSANRYNWPVVLEDVKKGIGMLTEAAQTDLTQRRSVPKTEKKDVRPSEKLTKEAACGKREKLVGLAEEIKTNDTRYSQKQHPAVATVDDVPQDKVPQPLQAKLETQADVDAEEQQEGAVHHAEDDQRPNAIIVADNDGEEEDQIIPLPKKKTSDLARKAYIQYADIIERSKRLEEKLER
ncbi:unnamed protein product [Mytilus coruscus]|uniref:Uncharacterized protein n=1 Tax=Mytilus coruscus TaxID=42192 RepID=A0A6J8A7Y8_MYTCO|nr:unnamed protein product [Mytilus coruscus]